MDEDIFLARREISQQTSINGVGGIAGAFCDLIRFDDTISGARGIGRTHSSIAGIFITWKFTVLYLVRVQWRVSVSGVGVALG